MTFFRTSRPSTGRQRPATVLRRTAASAVLAAASIGITSAAHAAPTVVVAPGDTLSAIAARHGTSWQALYETNRGVIGGNPNLLRVGQALTVGGGAPAAAPAPAASGASVHVVAPGDTLSAIASRYGTTWRALHEANRAVIGGNPNVLRVGQRLAVGQGGAAAASDRSQPASRSARSSADPRGTAAALVAERGWSGGQFGCLDRLWHAESGWRVTATNPSSGAYGIPQALPASKMASAGADWRTNATTQIRWGLEYIAGRYGDPCGAWNHFQARNWY